MAKAMRVWLAAALAATMFSCGSSSSTGTGGGGAAGSSAGASGAGGSSGSAGGGGGPACYHCGEVVLGMRMPSDVCPTSMDVYTKFIDCSCRGKCMTPCTGVCMNPDAGASQDCAVCVYQTGDQGCGDEFAACLADK